MIRLFDEPAGLLIMIGFLVIVRLITGCWYAGFVIAAALLFVAKAG